MKEKLDNICEECKKEDESVSQNLIMHGYKICESCRLSKHMESNRSSCHRLFGSDYLFGHDTKNFWSKLNWKNSF